MGQKHGGNLFEAQKKYGGVAADWIDLSTGINPVAYPVPVLPSECWATLPQSHTVAELETVARTAYRAHHEACVAGPGTSALIQYLSRIFSGHPVAIVSPTYTEHEEAFSSQCRLIRHPGEARADEGLIVVNPNNPDGRVWSRSDLGQHPFIIVDESFADIVPEHSLCRYDDLIVLRSFGKFYGLAGVRLGFVLCSEQNAVALRTMMGPWPVAGPALLIGTHALADTAWAKTTRNRLDQDMRHMHKCLASSATFVGGTSLFGLYRTDNAAQLQERLAQKYIWTRIFDYDPHWIRFGLAHPDCLDRLEEAIAWS